MVFCRSKDMGVPIMVKPEPLERLEFESPVLAAAVSGLDMLVFHTHTLAGTGIEKPVQGREKPVAS